TRLRSQRPPAPDGGTARHRPALRVRVGAEGAPSGARGSAPDPLPQAASVWSGSGSCAPTPPRGHGLRSMSKPPQDAVRALLRSGDVARMTMESAPLSMRTEFGPSPRCTVDGDAIHDTI